MSTPPPAAPPAGAPPAGTPPPAAPKFLKDVVPQDLHDRGYLKDLLDKELTPETYGAVFKKLDGAESLIGKKTLIPGADAKPEEWTPVLEKLRPAKAEDYGVEFGEKADKDFGKVFVEAAHHAGLGKVQLARQLEKLRPFFEAKEKAKQEAIDAREAEYAKVLGEMTGGADFAKKQERVMNAARELVPEAARKFIDKMKDNDLALFAVFADALLSKYAGEDDFKGKNPPSGGGGDDKESLVKELHTLYASEGWKNFQSPDHEKTKKRVDEILASPLFKTK